MKPRELFVGSLIACITVASAVGIHHSSKEKKASAAKKVTYRSSKQDKLESVNFLLYTRDNFDTPLLLNPDDASTLKAADTSKETVFLIHGWICNRTTFMETKNAYLKKNDMNVVIVEWDQLAISLYPKSRKDVEVIAARTAQLVDALLDAGQNPADMHIVGHSLGGHIAGIGASMVTKGTIGRVTALDAAGPSFKSSGNKEKVDSTDATFVQLVHTNNGVLGIKKAFGHVDFYVNDGKNQPACPTNDLGICSHMRAVDLFKQSVVDGKSFPARQCSTWKEFHSGKCDDNPVAYMGDSCSNSTRGIYFLKTASESPFTI